MGDVAKNIPWERGCPPIPHSNIWGLRLAPGPASAPGRAQVRYTF